MTDTVVAACETAHEAGVSEIIVADSHGNGENIRLECMPDYVQLVRSWPRPLGMMQGIEIGHYDGVLLIGYHAGASNIGGVLAHTMSGEFIHEVRLNGRVMSEAGISAVTAGHFGVPVLLVAGDDVAIEETRALLGDIATATLKASFGTISALNPAPQVAYERVRAAVRDALARKDEMQPFRIDGPIELDLRLRNRFMAEWLNYLDGIERLDAYSIRYRSADILGVWRFLTFLTFARSVIR